MANRSAKQPKPQANKVRPPSSKMAASLDSNNETKTAQPSNTDYKFGVQSKGEGLLWCLFYQITCARRQTPLYPMTIIALALIFGIPYANMLVMRRLAQNGGPQVNRFLYLMIMASPWASFYYILRSSYIKPNVDAKDWKEYLDKNPQVKKSLRFCDKCNDFRPYRASHCSFCNVCSVRKDHHCPWINNCVGFFNHYFFIMFLIVTIIALAFNLLNLYNSYKNLKALNLSPKSSDQQTLSFVIMISASFGGSLLFAIPCILFQQIQGVFTNSCGAEEYILEYINSQLKVQKKAQIKNPYDIDTSTNLAQIWYAGEHKGIEFPTKAGYSNEQYSRYGKMKDDSIQNMIQRLTNVVVTKVTYDGSLFMGDMKATLMHPKFYDTVLTFEPGELIYINKSKIPKSGWIKGYKIIDYGHGLSHVAGYFHRSHVKSPDDNNN